MGSNRIPGIRAIAAVTQEAFHSPQGGDAKGADKPKERE
jgi:hypothetical protein